MVLEARLFTSSLNSGSGQAGDGEIDKNGIVINSSAFLCNEGF